MRGGTYFEPVGCRIAIRLCVGLLASGRNSYRTVNIHNVRPDVGADEVAAVVRALEPLLGGRIAGVRLVRKFALRRGAVPSLCGALAVSRGSLMRPIPEACRAQSATPVNMIAGDVHDRSPGWALYFPRPVQEGTHGGIVMAAQHNSFPNAKGRRSARLCICCVFCFNGLLDGIGS